MLLHGLPTSTTVSSFAVGLTICRGQTRLYTRQVKFKWLILLNREETLTDEETQYVKGISIGYSNAPNETQAGSIGLQFIAVRGCVSRLTNPSTLHVLLQGRIPGVAVTFHSVFTLFFDIDSASLKDLVLLYYAVIGCGCINKQLKPSVSLSFHGKYQIFVFHFITNSRPQFLWKLNISFAFNNNDQIMHVLSMAPRFKRT